ncbi:hypothetical protein Tsubulata_051291 [Turnera subulata]|uniref:Magnesium-dependent phosphatase-1 n=1 Tax=Turnera subulata TaxID=218843 RepID=A0A9Q0F3H6_9ROSI|nr:hypothetical protein Tsubulata_051291 [Turnera subulata]
MGDDRVKNEALQIIGMFQVLPRLVVFDLDYTLWPFYCECRSKREMPSLYPQAKGILNAFKDKGIDMAIASRSPTPDIANTFIEKLNIKPMFVAKVSKMGVTSILVDNGVNLGALREGLTKFTQNVKTTEKNKERWAKFTQNPNSSKSKSED